jgi:hypothetical protein
MEIGVTLKVYSEDEHRYEILIHNDFIELRVFESPADLVGSEISFGSYKEMEEVGRAMIEAARITKEVNKGKESK